MPEGYKVLEFARDIFGPIIGHDISVTVGSVTFAAPCLVGVHTFGKYIVLDGSTSNCHGGRGQPVSAVFHAMMSEDWTHTKAGGRAVVQSSALDESWHLHGGGRVVPKLQTFDNTYTVAQLAKDHGLGPDCYAYATKGAYLRAFRAYIDTSEYAVNQRVSTFLLSPAFPDVGNKLRCEILYVLSMHPSAVRQRYDEGVLGAVYDKCMEFRSRGERFRIYGQPGADIMSLGGRRLYWDSRVQTIT